jgi:hypothetical protein
MGLAALTSVGLLIAGTTAGAKPACRTVHVSTSNGSAKAAVTPCERLNVGFEIGTQGQVFPVWGVSKKPAAKVLKLISKGYENSDPSGETSTQYFLFRAVARGTVTLRFRETTASSPGTLETFNLRVTVRR